MNALPTTPERLDVLIANLVNAARAAGHARGRRIPDDDFNKAEDAAIEALRAVSSNDEWRAAALRLGEQLADTGPDSYYGMTPTKWLEWCENNLGTRSETERRDAEMLVRLIELIKAMDMQAARITRVEGAEEVVEGYRFNTGCWHRILGTIAGHEASKWLQTPEGQARVKEAAERARLTIEELRANRPSWDEIKDKRFTI